MPIKDKTKDELKQLAMDIQANKVFTSAQLPEGEHLHTVFMIFAFMSEDTLTELLKDPPGLIYEYLSEAGPRSINGLPNFMTAKMINTSDAEKLYALLKDIKSALDKVGE